MSLFLQAFAAERSREVAAALQGMRQMLSSSTVDMGAESSMIQASLAQASANLKVGITCP